MRKKYGQARKAPAGEKEKQSSALAFAGRIVYNLGCINATRREPEAGTFASAAGGGRSEQKGVAAVEILRVISEQKISGTATGHNGAAPLSGNNYISRLSPTRELTYTEGYRSGHNGAVLKTVRAKVHAGSNPAPSAMKKALFVYQTKALFSTKSVLSDG